MKRKCQEKNKLTWKESLAWESPDGPQRALWSPPNPCSRYKTTHSNAQHKQVRPCLYNGCSFQRLFKSDPAYIMAAVFSVCSLFHNKVRITVFVCQLFRNREKYCKVTNFRMRLIFENQITSHFVNSNIIFGCPSVWRPTNRVAKHCVIETIGLFVVIHQHQFSLSGACHRSVCARKGL